MFFIRICSTTSLSGKMGCRRNEEREEREKNDMVGFFGANKIIGSTEINPFTARRLLPVYNVTPTFPIRRLQPWFYEIWRCAATYSYSDLFVEYRNARWQANLREASSCDDEK